MNTRLYTTLFLFLLSLSAFAQSSNERKQGAPGGGGGTGGATHEPVTVVDGSTIDFTQSGADNQTVTGEITGASTAALGEQIVSDGAGGITWTLPSAGVEQQVIFDTTAPSDTLSKWVDTSYNNADFYKAYRYQGGEWTQVDYWDKVQSFFVDDYIVAIGQGQSNLARSNPVQAGGDDATDSRIVIIREAGAGWEEWEYGSSPLDADLFGVSMPITFAKEYLANNPTHAVRIVSTAFPGIPIDRFLQGGGRYEDLRTKLSEGNVIEPVNVSFYIQGEANSNLSGTGVCSDCEGTEAFEYFKTSLDTIFSHLFDDEIIDNSTVQLFAQLAPDLNDRNDALRLYNYDVYPNTKYIYLEDLETYDGVHWTADAMTPAGKRAYRAYEGSSNSYQVPHFRYEKTTSDTMYLDLSAVSTIENSDDLFVRWTGYSEGRLMRVNWENSNRLCFQKLYEVNDCTEIPVSVVQSPTGWMDIEYRDSVFYVVAGNYEDDYPVVDYVESQSFELIQTNNVVETSLNVFNGSVGGNENYAVGQTFGFAETNDSIRFETNIGAGGDYRNVWISMDFDTVLERLTLGGTQGKGGQFGVSFQNLAGDTMRVMEGTSTGTIIFETVSPPILHQNTGNEMMAIVQKNGNVWAEYSSDNGTTWVVAHNFNSRVEKPDQITLKVNLANASSTLENPTIKYFPLNCDNSYDVARVKDLQKIGFGSINNTSPAFEFSDYIYTAVSTVQLPFSNFDGEICLHIDNAGGSITLDASTLNAGATIAHSVFSIPDNSSLCLRYDSDSKTWYPK